MTEKQYRLNKWGTRLLKNNRPLFDWMNDSDEVVDLLNSLNDENEQLQERNNRQAKQLDNLYTLIEKQDWKTLTGLIQEFQECEEQLRKEWGTYGDVE